MIDQVIEDGAEEGSDEHYYLKGPRMSPRGG